MNKAERTSATTSKEGSMSGVKLKVAAKAVIVNDKGQVLILREASTYEEGVNIGKWGIPGGRINDDEKFYDGLAREVREETGLDVEVDAPVYIGEWWPVIKGIPHHIVAMFVVCRTTTSDVTLSDEHDSYAWIDEATLADYAVMPPDDEPIKRALRARAL